MSAMAEARTVSVIVPTRALRQRGALLRRALDSVSAQEAVCAVPLVVINGPDRDPELTRELHADRRLRVATLEQADLPTALRAGREMVQTNWFTELDDDDVLLPGALAVRVQALEERPEFDAVVTSGFRRDAAGDALSIDDVRIVEQDPVRALLRHNWLLPGAWLCRTDTVGPGLFEGMPRFRECTYLALRLATSYRIKFLDCPTVVWHADTPLSESKSRGYVIGGVAALRRILELDLPSDVRAQFRTSISNACNAIADLHLKEGNLKKAWDWHLQSLREPGGWRYLPYTRLLVYALRKS